MLGAGMALFQAALITLIAILNYYKMTEHIFNIDLWSLVDVGIFLLIAWLIYRRISRPAWPCSLSDITLSASGS